MENDFQMLSLAIKLHKLQCQNEILIQTNQIEKRLRQMRLINCTNMINLFYMHLNCKKDEFIDYDEKIGNNINLHYITQKNISKKDVFRNLEGLNLMAQKQTFNNFFHIDFENINQIKKSILQKFHEMNSKIMNNAFKAIENRKGKKGILLPRIISFTDVRSESIRTFIEKKFRIMSNIVTSNCITALVKNFELQNIQKTNNLKNNLEQKFIEMNSIQLENTIKTLIRFEVSNDLKDNFKKMYKIILKNQQLWISEEFKLINQVKLTRIKNEITEKFFKLRKTILITQFIMVNSFQKSIQCVISDSSSQNDRCLKEKITESIYYLKKLTKSEKKRFKEELMKCMVNLGITLRYIEDIIKIRDVCTVFGNLEIMQ